MPVGIRARSDGSSRSVARDPSGSHPDRGLARRAERVVRAIAGGDRRLGGALRSHARRTPALVRGADLTASGMSTVFRTGEETALEINCLFGGWGKSTGRAWYVELLFLRPVVSNVQGHDPLDMAVRSNLRKIGR